MRTETESGMYHFTDNKSYSHTGEVTINQLFFRHLAFSNETMDGSDYDMGDSQLKMLCKEFLF